MSRRGYLDWLRGAAVLLMIEAHTMDAWTLPSDRDGWPYRVAIVLGGFAAPAFLFLAGVALALAAASRERRGATLARGGRDGAAPRLADLRPRVPVPAAGASSSAAAGSRSRC